MSSNVTYSNDARQKAVALAALVGWDWLDEKPQKNRTRHAQGSRREHGKGINPPFLLAHLQSKTSVNSAITD